MRSCKGIFNVLRAWHFPNTWHDGNVCVRDGLRIYTSHPTNGHPCWRSNQLLNPGYSRGGWVFIQPAHWEGVSRWRSTPVIIIVVPWFEETYGADGNLQGKRLTNHVHRRKQKTNISARNIIHRKQKFQLHKPYENEGRIRYSGYVTSICFTSDTRRFTQ